MAAVTLADLRLRVSSKLGLDNTSGSSEQALMDSWINEGLVELYLRTHPKVQVATMTMTANQGDYTIDSSILAINEIYTTDSSINYPLHRVTPADILYMRRGSSASTITHYYALNGSDLLMVYPAPASADVMTIYYVPRPTALSNATDTLPIQDEYHKALEYYALWQGGEYTNDSGSQGGMRFMQLYENELKKIRRDILKRGGRRLGRVIGGAHIRPYIPPYNSIDTGR